MSDVAEFYRLYNAAQAGEARLKEVKETLKDAYDKLVLICPHSEAVDNPSNLRGMGIRRRCKICGVTDYASQGGTPGDEYDYGYPGHPHDEFWKNATVETVDDKEFDSYSRAHSWRVKNGKVAK